MSYVIAECYFLETPPSSNTFSSTGSCLNYVSLPSLSDKFWFWRLAPNHKALHYGDCGESETLALDHLPNKRKFIKCGESEFKASEV